jgi:hypothetical protein
MRFHKVFLAATVVTAFAAPALGTLGGCGASDHAAHGDVGSLSAALSATGPDGAIYTLPANATLQLTPVDPVTGVLGTPTTLTFTQGDPTQTFSIPSGQYQGSLQGGPDFTLGREADGGADSVLATLTDPQPYTIQINAGQVTTLSFDFAIAGLGDVTFGTGTLQTGISVTNGEGGTASSGSLNGTFDVTSIVPPNPAGSNGKAEAPNPAIQKLLSGSALPATFSANLTFSVTGPFAAGVDSTCAPVTATGMSVPQGQGNAEDLFSEALSPLPGKTTDTGTLCFYDANGYATLLTNADGTPVIVANAVVLTFTRTGQPTSPSVTSALSGMTAPATGYTFEDVIVAQDTGNPPLFNGATLAQSQLIDGYTLASSVTEVEFDPTSDAVSATGASTGMPLTLTLTP